MYQKLVKEKKVFTELDAYVMGDHDEGLFVVQGKFEDKFSHDEVEEEIWTELNAFIESDIPKEELDKVKNKIESSMRFGELSVLNKAMALCMAELIEDADLVNTEFNRISEVTSKQVIEVGRKIFRKENCSSLHYKKK